MATNNVRVKVCVTLIDPATGNVIVEESSEIAGKPERIKQNAARLVMVDGGFMVKDLFDRYEENVKDGEQAKIIDAEEVE